MEKSFMFSFAVALFLQIGFGQNVAKKEINHDMHGMFIDLNTTGLVDLHYDSVLHKTFNLSNHKEVHFFIDPETGDTIYGRSIYVVNGYVVRGADKRYHLNSTLLLVDRGQLKLRSDGSKLKTSGYQIRNLGRKRKERNEKIMGFQQ